MQICVCLDHVIYKRTMQRHLKTDLTGLLKKLKSNWVDGPSILPPGSSMKTHLQWHKIQSDALTTVLLNIMAKCRKPLNALRRKNVEETVEHCISVSLGTCREITRAYYSLEKCTMENAIFHISNLEHIKHPCIPKPPSLYQCFILSSLTPNKPFQSVPDFFAQHWNSWHRYTCIHTQTRACYLCRSKGWIRNWNHRLLTVRRWTWASPFRWWSRDMEWSHSKIQRPTNQPKGPHNPSEGEESVKGTHRTNQRNLGHWFRDSYYKELHPVEHSVFLPRVQTSTTQITCVGFADKGA